MEPLRIALLQADAGSNTLENLKKGLLLCQEASELGADIALLPEMWSNGYSITEGDPAIWKQDALAPDTHYLDTYKNFARELNMAIALPFLEMWEGDPRNTVVLIDRHGEEVLRYAKVHTCDFGAEKNLTPGSDFYVTDLDTAKGPVRVGALICYDREFPESARVEMLKGAELILVPNACPMEINRLSQLRARAFENMLAIATCNYPAGHPDCNGHSTLFDGVAWLPDEEGSRDMCVLEAGEDEGIYIGELDLEQLRDYRAREVHGNAYRRPDKYHKLLDPAVEEPFVREDHR